MTRVRRRTCVAGRYVLGAGLLDTLEAARRTLDVLVAGEAEREGGLMAVEGWKTEPLKSEHRAVQLAVVPLIRSH